MGQKISSRDSPKRLRNNDVGTSLVVQWSRFLTPNEGGPGSFPGQGTRSCMPSGVARNKQTKSLILAISPGSTSMNEFKNRTM